MERRIARRLYVVLLRLHPCAFGRDFGDEMLRVFDEAAETYGVTWLLSDAVVSLGRQEGQLFSADVGASTNCNAEYFREEDRLSIRMPQCPRVAKDVRIKFFCSSSSVPKGYERCAFYFW